MEYTKKTWKNGEVITEAGLNNLEKGVSEALSHATDKSNPHGVTAAQVGAPSLNDIMRVLSETVTSEASAAITITIPEGYTKYRVTLSGLHADSMAILLYFQVNTAFRYFGVSTIKVQSSSPSMAVMEAYNTTKIAIAYNYEYGNKSTDTAVDGRLVLDIIVEGDRTILCGNKYSDNGVGTIYGLLPYVLREFSLVTESSYKLSAGVKIKIEGSK